MGRLVALRPVPADVTFDDIYARELGYVLHTLRRLGVPDRDREDVAHDLFVVVFRRLADYDRARPIRPWLFGIAYRVVADYHRSARTRPEPPGLDTHDPPVAVERLVARENQQLVLTALDRLPLERRAVFILHELDELTMPAIAEVIDSPLNTLYSHLRRARRDFADAVRELSRSGTGDAR